MATPKTPEDWNQLLRGFCKSLSPYALGKRSTQSIAEIVFRELFGVDYIVKLKNGKLLQSKDVLVCEGEPSVPGSVKVIGFVRKELDGLLEDIEDLKTNPLKKLNVEESLDIFIKLVARRKANSRIILVKPLEKPDKFEELMDILYSLKAPDGEESFKKRIRNYLFNIQKAKIKGTWKTVIEANNELQKKVGSAFSILTWGGAYRTARELYGKIPVLLGPCPLKHADYVEVARSGKVLKFRATGSVFLANQEGGADAIKIEGRLYKAEFLVMFMLWGLFLYGQSKFRDMKTIPGFGLGGLANITEIRKLNDIITTNTDLERPTYEFHQTFPFVSKHFIIPNCYIETISIEDKLPLKDTLKYTILLRTYEKPTKVTWLQDNKTGSRVSGFKNKTLSAKICEYSLNAGWRFLNYMGWLIDDQEWKIGSAMQEGALDTYYDVDWTSLSSVVYLNMIGAVT